MVLRCTAYGAGAIGRCLDGRSGGELRSRCIRKTIRWRPARNPRRKSEEGVWETVKVIIQALLIAFFVRTFLYQPFNIPSGSMYPTLKVGDYLFVSKLSYGYSKYSFNFSLSAFGRELGQMLPDRFSGPRGSRRYAQARRRRGVQAADRHRHRLHQAGDRPAGRPHPDARRACSIINGEAVKKERIEDYVDPVRRRRRASGPAVPAKPCPMA